MSDSKSTRHLMRMYRHRWLLAGLTSLLLFGLMGAGMAGVMAFSKGVDSLKENPPEKMQPKVFDARLELWFDSADPGLQTLYQIEDQFIPEDTVLVAFEDLEDPWGVFGEQSLATIARLTKEIRQIPYVRHVRSLTATPWVRWGEAEPGEEGLLVTDLFEEAPASYSRDDRLERMIAVLGAERAAALAGEKEVRRVLGPDASFDDYIGEPRLINGIISADGRSAALQVQLLRPKIPPEVIDETFGVDTPAAAAAPNIYASELQFKALDGIAAALDKEEAYQFHVAGMPPWERNFIDTGMRDMMWVGVMFAVLALVLFVIYRRGAAIAVPFLVVMSAIMGMNGVMFLFGDLMNNLTVLLPHLIVAVGIGDAIHLVTSYYAIKPGYTDKRELIVEVMRRNALPVFLTTITTAVGFASLITNTLIPFRIFGYAGALGVLFAYMASMAVVPAILSLLPLGSKSGDDKTDAERTATWTDKVVDFAVQRRYAVMGVALALMAVCAVGALRLNANADFRQWFPKDNATIRDVYWVQDRLGGMGDLEIIFSAPAPEEDWEAIRARQERIEALQIKRLRHLAASAPAEEGTEPEAAEAGEGTEAEAAAEATEPEAAEPEAAEPEAAEATEVADEAAAEATEPATPAAAAAAAPPLSADEQAELERLEKEEAAYQRRRIAVSPEFLAAVDRFDRRLREEMADPSSALSIVSNLESGLDVLRKINQVQHENRAEHYRIPTDADVPEDARTATLHVDEILGEAYLIPAQSASSLAAQYYLQYENGAKPVENLSTLISPDRRTFRIAARVHQGASDGHQAAFDRIREILQTEFPELAGTPSQVASGDAIATMTLTGKLFLFANMIDELGPNLIVSLSIAVLAITIMFVLIFRSLFMGLVSVVPNLLPVAIPIASIGFFGGMLDAPALTVTVIAFGVAVDATIHIFYKFKVARQDGLTPHEALREAYRQVGTACTYSTVVLVVAFSVMIFSDFRVNSMIGTFATIMIALAWVADFVLVPALLSFDRRQGKN